MVQGRDGERFDFQELFAFLGELSAELPEEPGSPVAPGWLLFLLLSSFISLHINFRANFSIIIMWIIYNH